MTAIALPRVNALIRAAIKESIAAKEQMLAQDDPVPAQIAACIVDALCAGGKVALFGNGGSAADAQHIAAEFVNHFLKQRRGLAAIALTTDTSVLTAVSNDSDFDQVFARQVEALVDRKDLVVAISTSGNSSSVLNGVLAARTKGAMTVGLTGQTGGQLKDLVDLCFCAPSDSTPRIQEVHVTVLHAICEVVERELCG